MNRNQIIEELAENHPAGAKLVEVSKDELSRTYGGGDVQPETSPACAVGGAVAGGLWVAHTVSYWNC
ncbi:MULTISPECIES: mersacidin family lantibiotic [Bacillus cereus group]|uniref:BacA protein n=2 Tax=Bacillus cereus group TaxID=86661 RepID=E5AK49_BACCE|nr:MULTISPECIES: mersacidin family lantibiotic [Bacillus cereus group]AKR13156.1 type 2 lantibiotic [Bacillus thuringiensis]AKR13172.1 type 2 lantibiotic [Bacillus thuringiensis]MDZ4588737.1 mersacidin family lantibiotic [Bacillus cereus]MDZ4599790.1 mersacidin family lantibiotic [Bacillus cereus]MED2798414.1 mersacidin family lantibiotic [Bacillus thuringiensis]